MPLTSHRRLLLGSGLAVWATVVALLVTGGWELTCTQNGIEIGGIDCLQALPQSARASREPAQTLGWVGLLTACLLGAGLLALGSVATARRRG